MFKYKTKWIIKEFLHPFKSGFWCIMAIGKPFYSNRFFFGMLWETWNSYAGDGDYGFEYFWTSNRKTWKELKWYNKFGIDDDGYFQFIIPYFLAWLLVLPGSIYNNYKLEKEIAKQNVYYRTHHYEDAIELEKKHGKI